MIFKTMFISGTVMVISGLVFLVSVLISNGPQTAKVGDTFVHANPGTGDDPNQAPRPFALIYRVKEVKDGKAHIEYHSVRLDGSTRTYENWREAYGLGKYDEKVQ